MGTYSRFMADDICSAAAVKAKGIIGRSVFEYLNWTGRFSVIPLDSIMGYIGPSTTPYSTVTALIIWFAVLSLATYQVVARSQQNGRLLVACLGAAIILFTTLDVTPLVAQSLFWAQGMRTVVPPLILGSAYFALLGYVYRQQGTERRLIWSILAGVLTFIAGGFAETYVVVQVSAITTGLLACIVSRRSELRERLLRLLLIGLICSLISMAVMFFAPGNKVRMAAFPPPPGVLELLRISSEGLKDFLVRMVLYPTRLVSLMGVTIATALYGAGFFQDGAQARTPGRMGKWAVVWLPFVTLLLLLSCNVPIAYGASLNLPGRTLIIPAYVLVCGLSAWGYFLGRSLYQRYDLFQARSKFLWHWLPVCLLFAFAIRALSGTYEMLLLRPALRNYAKGWDERERLIIKAKKEGASFAVVPQIENWALLDEVGPDPNLWVNQCVRDYYGVTVIATPEIRKDSR
jgi:hypothetical protein